MALLRSSFQDYSEEHPRKLIPELCKQFYNLGWVTGTGGGISIKLDDEIYIAPSGVQKERILPDDLFIQNIDGDDLQLPPDYKKWPGREFRCTHLEMIKGIYDHELGRYLRFDEELIVPIIENTPFEKDLEQRMEHAMKEYPGSSAVLVRRHGIYVWGHTWQKAKAMAECYDYLFSLTVEMKKLGLDPNDIPKYYRSNK
ncbi:AAEL011830-PC [Aedes aegypti]|uniref:Isoform C of Probable methylthioribulose-1-phosphate dehydratase n=1 Tax=Aedes aegypti TaxID=7159 RepID=Q16NX0-3|nr:AAEL011830-PC [Aedes aegypti]